MDVTEFVPAEGGDGAQRFARFRAEHPTMLAYSEGALAQFVVHVASCPELDDNARKVFTDRSCGALVKWTKQRGAQLFECSQCTPRLELRCAFDAFRKQSAWLSGCFDTFEILFDNEEPRRVLTRTAPHVFSALNVALQEYGILQAAKITDPARSWNRVAKAWVESLTVCNLNEHLQKHGLMNQAIEDAAAGVMRYRGFIKDARNKLIAHIDKAAAIADEPIGAHPAEEVVAFLKHLQAYNDEVGRAVGEEASEFNNRGQGDAITLLQFLRVGLHVKQTREDAWFAVANSDVPK